MSLCIGVVGKTPDKAQLYCSPDGGGDFVCLWPDSVAGSSGVCVGTFLPFFVLEEEEAGKGLALFRERQQLAWVGPGLGF